MKRCYLCKDKLENETAEIVLCNSCRSRRLADPVQLWMPVSVICAFLICIFSLPRLGAKLQDYREFDLGQQAEMAMDYPTAGNHYWKVQERYPESGVILTRLAIVYYKYGDKADALKIAAQLSNKKMPKWTADELARTIPEVQVQIK